MTTSRENSTEVQSNPQALLYVLERKMQETAALLEQHQYVTHGNRRAELQRQFDAMSRSWEGLKEPINSKDDLKAEMESVSDYDKLLLPLNEGNFDHLDIDELGNSDVRFFFDERFMSELTRAGNHMAFGDVIGHTIERTEEKLIHEAHADFEQHISETQSEITRLQTLDPFDPERKQLKDLEEELKEAKKQKDKFIQKALEGRRKEVRKAKVLRSMDQATLDQLKNTFIEARSIRVNKITEFGTLKVQKLKARLDLAGNALGTDQTQKIGESIKAMEATLRSGSLQKKVDLEKFMKGLEFADLILADAIEGAEKVETNRPALEQEAQTIYRRVKLNFGPSLTPSKPSTENPRDKQDNKPSETPSKKLGRFAGIKKAFRAGLAAMHLMTAVDISPQENLTGQVSITEKSQGKKAKQGAMELLDAQMQNLSEMSSNELKVLCEDLRTIEREVLEKLDAQKAHLAITELETAESSEEIKASLIKNLGEAHLDFITDEEFAPYKPYTDTGHMVYYQRGHEWKIIINEKALGEDTNLKELKKQLTHELLHVEFERGGTTQDKDGTVISLKEKLEKELVLNDPEEWKAIREAFMEMVGKTGEKDSNGEDKWPTEDILSELFAMQNELGNFEVPEGEGQGESGALTAKERLNNLLYRHGLNQRFDQSMGGVKAKILGYKQGLDPEASIEANDVRGGPFSNTLAPLPIEMPDVALINSNDEAIQKNAERLNKLKDSIHFQKVTDGLELVEKMLAFNEETDKLNRIGSKSNQVRIEERNKTIVKDLETLEGHANDISLKEQNVDMSFMRNMWNNTVFYSLEEFVKAGSQFWEYWTRRMNRRIEDHAARINMAVFQGSGMGLEATAQQQKIEAQEVGEWEGRIDKLDPIQLTTLLSNLAQGAFPDRDRFKAILRTLGKKGRIDWLNKDIWRVLNKIQSNVYFREDDPELLSNPNQLRLKLLKALGSFYDQEEFPGLEQSNSSSYESGKTAMEPIHKKTPTILTKRLNDVLSRHRSGEQTANPIEYESLINFCISQGRSYAENAMFHLIVGMAEGILNPDRGQTLASNLANKWPPIQWFEKAGTSQEYFQKLCETEFAEDYTEGNINGDGRGERFRSWFFTEITNKPIVVDRVSKTVKNREYDQDWSRTVMCTADANMIKQHYSGQGGMIVLQPPAVAASYVGHLQYLEENALRPTNAGRGDFARIAGNIIMQEGIIDGTAFRNELFTRQVENDREPNEASLGRYAGKTLAFHRKKLTNFLDQIEPGIFPKLRGINLGDPRDRERVGKEVARELLAKYPDLADPNIAGLNVTNIKSVDEIFDKIREIMKYIFSVMPQEKYNKILEYVRESAGKE